MLGRRIGAVFVAAASLVALGGTAAHADTTAGPPLSGETLAPPIASVFNDYTTDGSNPPGCNPSGTSTIEFNESGVAAGPYPGTFTEHGVLTIGPQTAQNGGELVGNVLSFHADFTITSPAGQVTGSKSLAPGGTSTGSCFGVSTANGAAFGYGYLNNFTFAERSAQVNLQYTATVHPTVGNAYSDSGTAYGRLFPEGRFTGDCTTNDPYCAQLVQYGIPTHIDNYFYSGVAGSGTTPEEGGFTEFFTVSNGTVPLLPTTQAQCKNGGYKQYLLFRNQGDCVSFVATSGKNAPRITTPAS